MKKQTLPNASSPPHIGAQQFRLLEQLCTARAVSGNEAQVRSIVLSEIEPYADQLSVDALGNVLAVRLGDPPGRMRVMVAAHMDEVGLMVTSDEGAGIYRFELVGGLDPRQLLGKAFWVGAQPVLGLISLGADPSQTAASSAKEKITHTDLRLDVSPANAGKVTPGDWATFATPFTRLGPSIRAKALDDRVGCANLIELFKHAPPNIDLLAAFTVQEEVGLRGARVAAYALDPHLAFVLDCTPARDLPAWDEQRGFIPSSENARYNTRLGAGPAIYTSDAVTLSDPRLVRYLMTTADALHIPCQLRQPGGGGTDAGAIHRQRLGIPTVSMSVPGRYIHSAAAIIRLEDWKNTLALIFHALQRLTPEILAVER